MSYQNQYWTYSDTSTSAATTYYSFNGTNANYITYPVYSTWTPMEVDESLRTPQSPSSSLRQISQEMKDYYKADGRSYRLLMEFLGKEIYMRLLKQKFLIVSSREVEGRIYRIRIRDMIDVYERDKDSSDCNYSFKFSLCIHPKDNDFPNGDYMLTQLLKLLCEEDQFLKTSKIHNTYESHPQLAVPQMEIIATR